MDKYCVDANVFIAAWHANYPSYIFPSLWVEISKRKDEIILLKPIFDEIEPIPSSDNKLDSQKKREKYPVKMWLTDEGFTETAVDDETNKTSLELERKYEINGISKGAGRNDILLISYAKEKNKIVVSLEANQEQKPKLKQNYKIPLICKEEGVSCIDFVKMMHELDIRI